MTAVTQVVDVDVNLRCSVFEMLPFFCGRFRNTGAICSACDRTVTFVFIFLSGEKETLIFILRSCLARCHSIVGMSALTNDG